MEHTRVLAVVTSHGAYDDGKETGLWLSELSHFYDLLTQAGYAVDIASIKGGRVPLDPDSVAHARLDASARDFLESSEKRNMLENTPALTEVQAKNYAAVFFAGGHGTMWDFKGNPGVQRIITQVHGSGGIIAAVCHGVAALVPAIDGEGKSLIAGRAVTGYSTLEERLINKRNKVPCLLESELVAASALYSRAWLPFIPYAVADGRVVTGQNPQSTKRVGRMVSALLKKPTPAALNNAKCGMCLSGTWFLGLFAVAWGIVALFGAAHLMQSPILAVVVILAGLGFLRYQYPFRPCVRCVAAVRTHESLG